MTPEHETRLISKVNALCKWRDDVSADIEALAEGQKAITDALITLNRNIKRLERSIFYLILTVIALGIYVITK